MSVTRFLHWSSGFIIASLLTGILALTAQAGEPVDVETSAWLTEGTMKAKLDGDKEEIEVDVYFYFGAGFGLEEGEFVMVVDDGEDPVEIPGTYTQDDTGKPKFTVLDEDLLDALGIELDEDIEVELKSKLKAKAKVKDGQDTLKAKFKIKVKLTDTFLDESTKAAFKYKGEGTYAPIE